jgi:V/A-type H+-transporting ATPase subunit I
MESEDTFSYLQGFLPKNTIDQVKKHAETNGWGYIIEDPAEEDSENIPTLVKMPKWLKMVKPIFSFMGTIPGYKEFDISFWFMMFFMVFVALLIGDAGYGCIFLGAGLFFHIKKGKQLKSKDAIYLIYTLAISVIAWGTVTGTWFGSVTIANLPFFKSMIVPSLSTFNPTVIKGFENNQQFIIFVCFLIGAIHLTLAHLIIILKRINTLRVFGDLGWIGIIWVMYFLANYFVIKRPLPSYTMTLLWISTVLAFLFNNPQKSIIKTLVESLKNLFTFIFDIIGVFSHIVSYIRLFAVGLATVAVASGFNQMAAGTNVISGAFIAIGGQSLNIVLAVMAVIVHGIRLNMLEFSSHLSMEWSGKDYKPFKD